MRRPTAVGALLLLACLAGLTACAPARVHVRPARTVVVRTPANRAPPPLAPVAEKSDGDDEVEEPAAPESPPPEEERNLEPMPTAPPPETLRAMAPLERETVMATARRQKGRGPFTIDGHRFRGDCSGLVRAAFSVLGIDVFALGAERGGNGVAMIHRFVQRYGELHRRPPAVGDIAFFDNTYDRNKNRRVDDPLTHVGLVDEVLPDGTVIVLHNSHRGVVRDPMSLTKPHVRKEGGVVLNGYLRAKKRRDRPGIPYLAGELFAGYGTLGLPPSDDGPKFEAVAEPEEPDDDLPSELIPKVP